MDKEGDDKADEAADIAINMHGRELVSIASTFHKRHNHYRKFMTNVAKHVIEGYLIQRKLVDKQQASKQPSKAMVTYQSVQMQGPSNSTK